jgi:hypothetical protein
MRVKPLGKSSPINPKQMFDIFYILFTAIKCVSFVLVGVPENMEQIWYTMILYTQMTLIVFQQDT